MEQITVVEKSATLEHIDSLISLILKQMETIGSKKDSDHVKRAIINASRDSSNAVFFLCFKDDTIAAFAFGNVCAGLETGADYLWLNELFVDENFRNMNIGSRLVSFIENWSKERNIRYIACITGSENIPAQNLYTKNGFELSKTLWVDKSIE